MNDEIRQLGAGEWQLLIPPGWATLPTAAERRKAAVTRAMDRMLAGRHRDELITLRIEVESQLLAMLAEAAQNGVLRVHALTEPIRGVPVSGALVVSELVLASDDDLFAAVAKAFSGDEGVVEVDRFMLAGCETVRRRRHVLAPVVEGSEPVWTTSVEYLVGTGPLEILALAFTTSTEPVADEMVALFDSIAESLHRRAPR